MDVEATHRVDERREIHVDEGTNPSTTAKVINARIQVSFALQD